ncbi:MAG: hypothetical protein VXZ58_01670 [Actinomycetota bacterium]|nr:hypothetical protein [Actinomycetota bacterium]
MSWWRANEAEEAMDRATERATEAVNNLLGITPATAGSLNHLLIDEENHGPSASDRTPLVDIGVDVDLDVDDTLRYVRAGYWNTEPGNPARIDYLNPKNLRKDVLTIPFDLAIVKSTTDDTGYQTLDSGRFFGVGHEVAILADQTAFIDPASGIYNGILFDEYLNSTITVRQEEVVEVYPGKIPGEVRERREYRDVEVPKRRVIIPDEIYQYNSFAFNAPMLGKEANAYADLRSPLVAGAGSEYVYNSGEYELASSLVRSELVLPNIYSTYLARGAIKEDPELGTGYTGRHYIDHTNLAGAFNQQLRDGDYFRQWTNTRANEARLARDGDPEAQRRSKEMAQLTAKFRNVFFDPDEVKALRDMNRHKNSFPFYNEVQFTAERESEFVNLLTATGLSNRFIFSMLHDMEKEVNNFGQYVEQKEVINATEAVDESGEVQVVDPEREFQISQEERRVTDMESVLLHLEDGTLFQGEGRLARIELMYNATTVLGSRGFESLLPEEGRFERNILDRIFMAKLEQMLKKYFLSWDTSFSINSEPTVCHSETVAYRVRKTKVNQDTNERSFVQNFFFLNTPTLKDVELIDTQVSFGSYYEYTVFAHKLVFGTKYRYSTPYPKPTGAPTSPTKYIVGPSAGGSTDPADPRERLRQQSSQMPETAYGVPTDKNLTLNCEINSQENKGGGAQTINMQQIDQFRFCVFSEPYAHFVEVPYKTFAPVKVTDRNPAIPHMLIVPYRQVTDRVLINLNSGMDDYVDHPISILEEDREHFDEVRRANGLPPESPIRFKTDDGIGKDGYFEVWRLDRRPEKYEDFAEGEVSVVRPSEHSRLNPDSGALTLFVKPNRKYYVCSRIIDVHGNISNPTEVHEIEIVYDDGVMFFRERAIELKPIEPPRTLEKKMKRFVKICPNLTQSVISGKFEDGLMDAETAMEFDQVKLGEAEKSVWGRKFKIRFVSKDTGRKIDLNLDFTRRHTKVYGPDEN